MAAVVRSVNHKAGCHNSLPSYTGYEACSCRTSTRGHRSAEHGLRRANICVQQARPHRGPANCPTTSTCPASSAGARLSAAAGPVRRLPRQALRCAHHRVRPVQGPRTRRAGRRASRSPFVAMPQLPGQPSLAPACHARSPRPPPSLVAADRRRRPPDRSPARLEPVTTATQQRAFGVLTSAKTAEALSTCPAVDGPRRSTATAAPCSATAR